MNRADVNRRLAAVLAADVVGYSRLMGDNEEATHAAYKACMAEVFEPLLEAWRGRIVKRTGDGFLAEFQSVVHAVEYALAAQQRIADGGIVPEGGTALAFRIGINLGDIIVEAEDIYGDGVNVAARLEGLAEPGGICISDVVYEQVRGKVPLAATALGPQKVKNIANPIEAYAVRAARRRGGAAALRRPLRVRIRHPAWAAALFVFAAGIVALGVFYPDIGRQVREGLDSPPKLPKAPSIAVLAFDNMSDDPGQEYFSDGISEDIITDLSKHPGLFVISRNSSFSYKGRPVKVQTVGRELGVRYVLEGSVRRAGGMLRINAQLVDAQTGGHLWAERFDRPVKEVFQVQDEISRWIVSALALKLGQPASSQTGRAGTDSIEAYDAYLQGMFHYRRRTPDDFAKAARSFKRAVMLDADFSRAYAALASTYINARNHLWLGEIGIDSAATAIERAREYVDRAKTRPNAFAHRVAAQLAYNDGRYDEAVAAAKQAVALDPNDAESHARLGITLVWAGHAEEAEAPLRLAMRLDPRYPAGYLSRLGVVKFAQGAFADSIDLLERAFKRNPHNFLPLVHLVAAYGQQGEAEKARETLQKMNTLRAERGLGPYSRNLSMKRARYSRDEDRQRLFDGLTKAGVP